MKIKNHKDLKNTELCEVSQDSSITFAIGRQRDDEIEKLTPFFVCRDFINDFFVGVYQQAEMNMIYSFGPFNEPLIKSKERPFLLVSFTNNKLSRSILVQAIKCLNKELASNGRQKLKLIPVYNTEEFVGSRHDKEINNHQSPVYAIKMPHYWWRNSFSVAYITQRIRTVFRGFELKAPELESNEYNLISSFGEKYYEFVYSFIKKLPDLRGKENLYNCLFTGHVSRNVYTSAVHNCGVQYFSRGIKQQEINHDNKDSNVLFSHLYKYHKEV